MPIPSIRDIWNNALQNTDAIREKRPFSNYQNNTGRLDASAEMEHISANASVDPQQYKQQAVLNAAERKRKQLGLTQELNKQEDTALRLAGRTEEYVQANAQQRAILQNMTDEERADNYLRYKSNDPSAIPDKYVDQDFHNLNDMELEARYGIGIGEIKRRDAIDTLGLAQQATQQSLHSGLDRPWYNPANTLGSFISGAGKTIDGTGDLLEVGRGALEGDMSKAYENINKHGIGNNIQDFGESLLSSDWQAAKARDRALDRLDEKVVDQIAAANELGGLDATEARREANDIVDSVALDRLPDARNIYQQSLEQVPELLAGASIGAVVRKGATAGARAVINNTVRKAANKAGETARNKALKEATEDLVQTRISSVGKQQAQNNISTYGKKSITNKDLNSRIGLGEKIKPHKEAIKSKAKHDINNSSLVQQEAKEKAKDISDKFVRRSQNAVNNKAAKVGNIAGLLGIGTYFGGREGSSAAGDAYQQIKDMNASYVASSPEGKKLKEQYPNWTDEQIQEQIAQNAASTAFGRQGATSFVSSTVFSGAESRLFGYGRAGTFKGAVKNTANSIAGEVPQEYIEEYGGTYNPRVAINKALGKEHFKEDTGDLRSKAHVRGVQGAITAAGSTTLTNAHELIPTGLKESTIAVTSKVKDIKANQRAKKEEQEIQQASVTDTGSKTNFGKTIETTNEELSKVQGVEEDHPLGKAIKEGNFSKIVSEFDKEAKAAQARIDSGKSENIENDQAIIDSYNIYREKITNAIGEDFKATRQTIETNIDKAVEAINSDEAVMSGIANLIQTDPSIIAKTDDGSVDQFQTVINATQKLNPKLYNDFTKALSKLDDFEDASRILETPSIRTLTETNKQQSTDNSIGSTEDIRAGQTGSVGTITTRQLSRINTDLENEVKELENLDKNSEDYATKLKDFATKANNLILSLPTIQSSLEASESKQAWSDIAKYLSTLRNAAKQYEVKLDNNALLTRLHKTISDINKLIKEQNLSDKEAKTLFDKFVGSKGKKGLLTYVQESFTGNGLSPRGVYQLSHFLATQNVKHKMLGLIANTLQNVDSGSFRPFKYKNPTLKRSSKGKQQNELDDVYFETMEQFHKYYQTTGREVKIFNDLANSILNNEELTFGASIKNTEKSEDTGFTPSEETKKVENETANFERDARNKQDGQDKQDENTQTNKQDDGTSVQESTETTTKDTSNKKLKDKLRAVYSGGAYGADSIWDSMLHKFGVDSTIIKHFVLGQNKSITINQLNVENVNDTVVDQVKNLANNTQNKVLSNYLNRLLRNHDNDKSNGKYVSKLLLRNVLQVSNSNGVFGVMPIVDGKLGKSGTKVAVELGAISNRPTYVLNTEDSQWYSVTYANGDFNIKSVNGIPTITSKPALVGTRAIESYYKNGELTKLHRNTNNILNAMEDFLLINNNQKFSKPEEITINLDYNSNNDNSISEVSNNETTIGDVQENFQENLEENQKQIETEDNIEDNKEDTSDVEYQDPDEAEFKHTKSVEESKLNPTQKHLLNNRSYIKHILDRLWQQGKNSGKLDDSSFMATRVFWRSVGLNYDVDFFKTAKFKVRNLIGSDKLNAVRSLNTKSTPEERINAYGDMFGIKPEVLKDLSGEEKFAVVSYANAYVGLKDNIDKYFSKLPDAITKLRLNDITPLQAKLRPTALLNFIQFQASDNNGNGKWFFGDDFKQAIVNALIKTFQEEGQRSTKASQVIENLTRGHTLYNVIEMNDHIGLTDEKLNYKIMTSDPTVSIKSLEAKAAVLGSNKEQFIETLGRNALDRLGVVLDPKESKSNQGIIGSLGQELFNALLEMGVVEVNRVQYYDKFKHPSQYIDHVNFSWNTGFEQSKPEENNSREWFKASRSSQNNQPNKFTGNIYAKHFAGIKTGFNTIAHDTLFPEAKQNYNGVRVTTDGSSNPFTVTNRDIETELTSGNNNEAKSYVQALNNIPYKPNTDFYNFFKHGLGELGKAVLGYTDISLVDTTDRIKDKFISKNSQIDRDIDILETYFNNPNVDGNIDKLRFFIKHRLMSNQRIQFEGALNPQSSKNIRQMLVQDSKHTTTTFKPTKPIKEFFEGLNKSNNTHELGYGLAVAQALGIKIERVYDREAFDEMAKLLSNPDHIFNKMVGLISEVEETNSLPDNAADIVADFSAYGNDAMRVLHTAFTVAQYNKALKSGSDFKSHLTIEADGIGNGVHNSLRQFAIGFTPAYFHSLKRTGVVTLDLAYKAMLEEKKDLDMIEGAKHIFRKDPKGKDNIDDVYEAVSGAVASTLSKIIKAVADSEYAEFTEKTYNNLFEILDDHELIEDANNDTSVYPTEFEQRAYFEIRKDTAKYLLNQVRSLVLLDSIGMLEAQFNDKKVNLLHTNLKYLTSKNISLSVARSFAKAGVTPANYGGKLEGITKQLRSDISKKLDELAEKAYKRAKDTSNVSPDEVKEANIQLRLFAKALMPLTLNEIDFKYKAKTREDVARNANIIANAFASSLEVHKNLKESLGQLMKTAIDNVYQEQFDAIDFAISADNALFYEFEQEFNDLYAQKIRQRNIKRKWATYDNNGNIDEYLDPRANDGLTKGEIKDILANMHNSPVIATAMSKNNVLINQLFNAGNSLIKTSKGINLEDKRVAYTSRPSEVAKNANGNLTVIGTTIRDAYRKFDPAGAAALVQSVVSTESATQGRLAIELAKDGLYVLDVFDGAEMPPHMREFIGNKINEFTNQVHLETRLMEAFFHKLNRSGLAESIQKLNFKNIDELVKLSNYGTSATVRDQKLSINKDNVKFLNTYVSMETGRLLYMRLNDPTNKDTTAYLDNIKKVRIIANNLTEALANGKSEVKLTSEDLTALGLSGIRTIRTINHLNSKYNNYLRQFADLAARNRAMKDIETTYLPAVINQFGGVSSGYAHLKESKLAKQTLDAFRDWLKKEGLEVADINMRTQQGSAILSKFVTEHFKDELNQKRTYYAKQLAPNYIKSNVLNTKFTTVGDFINSVIENSGTKDSTINPTLTNTIKALVEPIKQIVGEDTKIYTNKKEFEEKFGKIQDKHSTGTYVGLINNNKVEHGIFVLEDGDVITALHEILHGIQEGYFNSYVKNPDNLDTKVKAAIDDLKTIALDVASLYKNNPEVAKLLEQANKLKENSINLYNNNNSLMASMANITYVFSPEAAKNIPAEQLANAQVVALKEFWAYGLSQPEILNRLRYSGVRGRKDKLSLLDKLVNLFKQMRTKVAQAFGFTNGKEAPNSYLIDALAAINVIGQRTQDSTKYKDIKTYSLNDLDTVQLSRVKVKPQNQLLFQVAGLTASTTNKPATQVFKDIVDTSFNISREHGEHLQALFDTVMNGIQAHKDLGKPLQLNHATAWAMLENNDLDSTANEIIRDLSKVGMVMNDAEKTVFKLMYAVNKASYDSNHQLTIETQNLMDNIIRHIEPSKFLDNGALVYNGSDKFNAVFNNKQDPNNQMAMVMALATTHEEFRNYLQQAITQDKPTGIKRFNKKLAEVFTNATLYSNIANQITGFKDKTIVDKLNLVAAGLEFKNNVGDISRQQQQDDLLLAQTKQLEAADFVNDLADGLSNQTVRNLVKGVGGFVLSGKGLTSDDADSTFRKMVQDIVDDVEYINERPTFFTKLWRWFMGAYDQTQLAYKLRSQNAILSDAVREKVGNAISASIESEFNELTDTDRKALSKAVMPIRLHALFNLRGHLQVSVPQILSDSQVHQNEINAFKQELSNKVAQILPTLNPTQQKQVVNYLNWQTAGLGELMVKGIAKGSKNTTHGILPNVRAIGAMVQLKALNAQFKRSIEAISTQDMADLVDVLQGLSTLQALRYVSQSDKDTVVKLFQNERKGMKALLAELTDMDKNALKVDPYGLLGYDGYIHNKRNPNADIQVLSNVTPEQHQELVYLGWEYSMTLPNGEAVYTTQNSLRSNWTTGAFGTSELNSFGANVVTGRSLRSTGSEVSPQLKLGKELQQRFAKILATQDYYDTLSDYSHYRPIINRTGSISGFEVDVSNEQRDSVIASLENDIASVGNYQARLVEEGITAKNNDRAINALNHAYQQARDKSRYIKIDGKAKPRSNNPADVQFAERLNNFFYMLPEVNRNKIIQDGLYVHRHEVDNLIGYYQASTADIFLGTSGLPEPVQKAFKAVAHEMYRTFGVKSPAVLLRQAGRFTGEFASLTKDFILNRSMIVPAQNLLSNVLQLITAGIPVKQVVPLMIEGYRNAKAYTENQSRIIALEHELAVRNLNASQQAKHRAEILSLVNANNRNPAKILVQNGILTSVTDLSISNDKEDNEFSLFNTLSNKYGISKIRQEIPQGIKELLIQDGTKMHNAMMALMDYGDFVAKYALYHYMTKSRGLEPEHAMNIIRDEFVDYAMNRGREFDWANKIGLTWFLSYKLAIQKIFFRNLRRNALRTMAVWGSSRLVGELTSGVPLVRDVIGETVNDQIYPIKHSLYHITPHHEDIIDAHWIHKVLEAF